MTRIRYLSRGIRVDALQMGEWIRGGPSARIVLCEMITHHIFTNRIG